MYTYINTVILLCQQKLYDKKLQIITDINIPTKSAINAAVRTKRIFFIPTQLV